MCLSGLALILYRLPLLWGRLLEDYLEFGLWQSYFHRDIPIFFMKKKHKSKYTGVLLLIFIMFVLGASLYFAWVTYFIDDSSNQQYILGESKKNIFNEENVSWNHIHDEITGIQFSYPENFGSKYVTPAEWPPKLKSGTFVYECEEITEEPNILKQTYGKNIQGTYYCISISSEGAAGSVYITYSYTFEYGGKAIEMNFSIQKVQCANYDEPQKSTCKDAQDSFDIDSLVDQIVESIE